MRPLLSLASFVLLYATLVAQDHGLMLAHARAHLDTLTSPAFHGRGYVNGGDSIAAEYLARHFDRVGLKPVKDDFFQPFTFNVNSFPDSVLASIDGRRLEPGTDFLVHPASGSAEGTYRLVHITADDMLDPTRRAMTMGVVAGHVACLHLPATKDADTLQLFAAMEHELMHLVPVVRPMHGKLTWSVAREALPHPLVQVAPGVLSDSAGTITLRIRNHLRVRHEARNVLGMVKGKGKGWIVIGAHYDHLGRMGPEALFPGANDNASGVAMLLALAEYFATKPAKHNILFVAFAGEEAGLLGSEWCVVDRPIDFGSVRMMISLDILGTGDDGITVVNATAEQDTYDRLVAINDAGAHLAQVKARGPTCNSDHCPFVKRGIPGIFIYTMGGVAHYHDVLDKADTLPLTKFPGVYEVLKEYIATSK